MVKVAKQWKADGEEDKKLESLITKGKINKFTTPKELQKEYPDVFGTFSLQVMRNHLNAAKRAKGLYLDTAEDNELRNTQDTRDVNEEETPCGSSARCEVVIDLVGSTQHNYPIIMKHFACPETQTDKILLVVALPGGAQDVRVVLHDDGIGVSIKYTWPKVTYTENDLFRKKLQAQGFHQYHPLILCYQSGLEQVRNKIDAAPEGLIKVVLPVQVQTAIGSWEKWGAKREDGSHVLLAVFSCFVKDYVKKLVDESVVYD